MSSITVSFPENSTSGPPVCRLLKGGQERRRELPAPAFNAIVDALEAQGRPLEGLDPQDRIFESPTRPTTPTCGSTPAGRGWPA